MNQNGQEIGKCFSDRGVFHSLWKANTNLAAGKRGQGPAAAAQISGDFRVIDTFTAVGHSRTPPQHPGPGSNNSCTFVDHLIGAAKPAIRLNPHAEGICERIKVNVSAETFFSETVIRLMAVWRVISAEKNELNLPLNYSNEGDRFRGMFE